MREEESSLLIIRMSALGDVAMTIPAIYSLARQYPSYRLKVLTQPFFGRLFVNAPHNVQLILVNKKDYRGLGGIKRLIDKLKGEDIDGVADFHNVIYSWLIDLYFRLRGKPVEVLRKHWINRIPLVRRRYKVRTDHRNYTLRYFDVLRRLGLAVTPSFTSLLDGGEPATLPSCIPPKGKEKWIGIAPFARYYNKTYPLQLMRETIGILAERGDAVIFLFGGGEKERTILNLWGAEHHSTISLPGRLTLEQELTLMSRLDVMISMDSANMHMASLVGTPVISLWGGTSPHCGFMGWGQDRQNAMAAGTGCQPCTIAGSDRCPQHNLACMYAITPDDICRKVERIIG
ncbi:MAG: glycosyltransferase family 9 protein [Prevotellaceae bacterium]|nr:glycosyltransferase family 9 protein [Prevotellaceae bacterium]